MSDVRFTGRKVVGFGAGLATLATLRSSGIRPELLVDGTEALWGQTLLGVPIAAPAALGAMVHDGQRPFVIVCAYGGRSVARIFESLVELGLEQNRDFCECSEFLVTTMSQTLSTRLGHESLESRCHDIRELMLSRAIDNQSSVAGTWLVVELLHWLRANGVAGDVAEAGVFQGGNALLVLETLGEELAGRGYHLFDSFEGLPEVSERDPASRAGEFANVSFDSICKSFAPYHRAQLHKGWFVDTFPTRTEDRYCLAYVDCDLYEPTVECCEFFYERLSAGGVLLFHDYWVADSALPMGGREPFTGVRTAVDEFAAARGVRIVRFPETTHALLVR